jgi:hypothetical protein
MCFGMYEFEEFGLCKEVLDGLQECIPNIQTPIHC